MLNAHATKAMNNLWARARARASSKRPLADCDLPRQTMAETASLLKFAKVCLSLTEFAKVCLSKLW